MKNRLLNTISILTTSLLLCCQANADSFLVQDQHGLPVKNAVLEFSVTHSAADVSTANSSKADSAPKTLTMDQVNKRFEPELLIIHKGDYVSFPNSDDIRHHVYSFSKVMPFELKLYSGKPKAPLQFTTPGISVLGCNIHDSMVGYIYIADSTQVLLTDDQGIATLDDRIKYQSVKVWHANLSTSLTRAETIDYDDLAKAANTDGQLVIKLIVDSPEPRKTFQSIFKKHGK